MQHLILFTCLITACLTAFATPYKVLPSNQQTPDDSGKPVQIVEFFSYACPWCARLDPVLRPWLKQHAKDVNIVRIPVEFQKEWTTLSKAYYAAAALGKEEQLSPAIFAAQQKYGHKKVLSHEQLATIFKTHGIRPDMFKQIMQGSAALDAKLDAGRAEARRLNIYQIPTLIVAGRYQTDPQLAGSIADMPKVLDELIHKVRSNTK